jgi:UDP-N-acetylglucosamine 2-epimerase
MYDSILYYSQLAEKKSTILRDLDLISYNGSRTPNSKLRAPNYYLATFHRAENTDNPSRLKSILKALKEIGKDIPVILPLHPRTKKMIDTYHLFRETKGIKLIDPVCYLDMLKLEKHAKVILTDSGGVQKEAFWFRVPCITLRDETEWMETIQGGWNVLAGSRTKSIVEEVRHRVGEKLTSKGMGLFGDGKASGRIVKIIVSHCL